MSRFKLFVPLIIFAVLSIFLFIGLSKDPNELPSALVGKSLPEFKLPGLKDESIIEREQLIGEPFLLNVWATWCPTCIHEHPYLMKLAEQGIRIVGLNYKDENLKALSWLDRLGDPYLRNIVDQEGRLGLRLGVYGAPETFIIDSDGIILYRHAGDLNERVWQKHFAAIWNTL
ncbi:MAG: DsbE family thiol:disulfide interchange protein [Agarilytica sp.]